jgi:hypothetical protein
MPRAKRRTATGAPAQPVRATPGGTYGDVAAQERAQQAVPLPQNVEPVDLGSLPPLTSPTQRPDEPVTAGLPVGAGPGPAAAVPRPDISDPRLYLEALVQLTQDPEAYELLAELRAARLIRAEPPSDDGRTPILPERVLPPQSRDSIQASTMSRPVTTSGTSSQTRQQESMSRSSDIAEEDRPL